MQLKLGIMQGRLLPKIDGRYQCFPAFNWQKEFYNMMNESSYIHISDNDGLHDLNSRLTKPSSLISMLSGCKTSNKDFTLEVYDDINSIKKSYDILSEAIS